MMKKRALVVCPGRGTYTKDTLNYLRQNGSHISQFLADIDQRRRDKDAPTITALDSAEIFKPQVHTRGENASSLIYSCAYADFMAISREKFDIVAITGNSMGWYLTLAFGGALDWAGSFHLIDTMGSMMKDEIIGGQIIYPIIDDQWRASESRRLEVMEVANRIASREGCEVYTSIYLGGYLVFGGNRNGLNALLKELPQVENYPFQLLNHAAFHTPLLKSTSQRAFQEIPGTIFRRPQVPLIDGRGHVWQPYSTDVSDLYSYTLAHQVVEPYDFTKAITVGLKEFMPDALILLGPGSSLGGATGQILIENDWLGIKSKSDFTARQENEPFVLAMGRPDQRQLVL